jgi:hypothetical protein
VSLPARYSFRNSSGSFAKFTAIRRLWHQMSEDRRDSETDDQEFQRSCLAAVWFHVIECHIQHGCYQANDEIIKAENKQATAPERALITFYYLAAFLVGLRVRMQPQTINAATIAQKVQSCICYIVVFSVA